MEICLDQHTRTNVKEIGIMMNAYKLENTKFGNLLVLERCGSVCGKNGKNRNQQWLCKCDCGEITKKPTSALMKKGNISCSRGCILHCGKNSKMFGGFEEIPGAYWAKIKNGAKKRNIHFNISMEEAWEIFLNQNHKCSLSGQLITFSKNNSDRTGGTASLDRIDSLSDYSKNNCQWVHKDINTMKWNFSNDYIIQMCKLITMHRGI